MVDVRSSVLDRRLERNGIDNGAFFFLYVLIEWRRMQLCIL
jgi:hypothetical protein